MRTAAYRPDVAIAVGYVEAKPDAPGRSGDGASLRRRTLRRNTFRIPLAAIVLSMCAAATAIEPARQTELKYLLEQDCGSCHGMTLKGGLGPALLPANLDGKPDGLLIATILEGRPGTAMPPWRGLLTEAEAEWLVEQLRKGK